METPIAGSAPAGRGTWNSRTAYASPAVTVAREIRIGTTPRPMYRANRLAGETSKCSIVPPSFSLSVVWQTEKTEEYVAVATALPRTTKETGEAGLFARVATNAKNSI